MFVIIFPDGTFLNRKVNCSSYQKRRRTVATIDEASTWTNRGHAKNALIAAVEAGELKNGTEATIMRVKMVPMIEDIEPVVVRKRERGTKVEPR